jgi:hypothetical protein
MMNLGQQANGVALWRLLSAFAVLTFCSTAALGANIITGSVRNQTRGEPAIGDEVLLLRPVLDRGTQEEAHAKTDAHGAFTFNARFPDQPYLVRVVHQGVPYDQRAFAGDAINIQVFDVAPQVSRVTGTIEILRAGTKGNLLHVSDMVEIKNESFPPLTQANEHTFEAYLPSNAKLDSVLAAAPGKIATIISAAAVPGEAGHYTVSFPLQPGATKFAFNYDLPYRGHAAFQTMHPYPLQQFAVMIPRTMKFSSRSSAFETLATGNTDYQVRVITPVKAGKGPPFELSGAGTLPSVPEQAKAQQTHAQSPSLSNPAPSVPRTLSPSLPAIAARPVLPQSSSQSLVLGALTLILLAVCALQIWCAHKARKTTAA